MKKIYCLLFLISMASLVKAQDGFSRSSLSYNGVNYPCYSKKFDVAAEVIEKAFESKMQRMGFRNTGRRGVYLYRDVIIAGVNNGSRCDVLAKVERDGKKGEAPSTLYLVVTSPGNIGNEKLRGDAAKTAAASVTLAEVSSDFQNELRNDIGVKQFDTELEALEAAFAKQERQLSDLQKDRNSIQDRLEKARKDLDNNEKDIENKRKDLEEARKKLDEKKARMPIRN